VSPVPTGFLLDCRPYLLILYAEYRIGRNLPQLGKSTNVHIDSYEFGRIVVDGVSYTTDVLLIGQQVRENWWRKAGHSLCVEDIEPVIAAKPAVLVVGCGAYSMMNVPEQTSKAVQQQGIALEATDTAAAAGRFNELSGKGANVAAALHLTC